MEGLAMIETIRKVQELEQANSRGEVSFHPFSLILPTSFCLIFCLGERRASSSRLTKQPQNFAENPPTKKIKPGPPY